MHVDSEVDVVFVAAEMHSGREFSMAINLIECFSSKSGQK